ncbi:MAG: BrnA antitoxin family protein [Gemmatimonadetes bacterium]|nr:BrnA antitoxin family protein [Gemmatimonadota bacterium]MBI2401732.1 BrnA antitoxin family protein [Gemmatimonadota bacterium]MBI2535859.1 BrnA antitoxin family protein [Gemmatimonadota bacterium]
MNERRIVRRSRRDRKGKTDWARVDALTDEDIAKAVAEDPDAAPLLDAEWFKQARIVLPEPKVAVSIRLDREVLDWFKRLGPGYQTRMNAVLRAYVQAHRKSR